MIPKISAEDLKKMQDREGLVLQGCGGDLREWEDGIHQMLAEEKILQNGAHFKEIYAFEHDGCTNLLFMMDGIELDTGRLVLWCALPGFVDSKNEEKTERNAGYLVVSHSGGGMLRQGTRKGIRRTPANRGMRAHWVVKGLDISEDVCHGMCP